MNLGKKYKQLFEGKTRSNDSKLLNEASEGELIKIHKPFKFWEVEGERLKKELIYNQDIKDIFIIFILYKKDQSLAIIKLKTKK